MSGHEVAALLDTGSEITTVTETWAAAHLQDRSLQQAFLTLRAVNGAEVPYSGILLVDIDILGKRCPDVPVLVVKEPTELSMQQRKRRLPVLVGMNVLRSCFPPEPARSPHVFRLSSARFDCSSEQPPRASLGPHLAATSQPTP
ncbi:MAG: retropepsin-like domain-containing protein [Sulfurovum sp.]|nr:retropepsin-like domain-containing protein [Sulfurovum sp.]